MLNYKNVLFQKKRLIEAHKKSKTFLQETISHRGCLQKALASYLTISLKKTQARSQAIPMPPTIRINEQKLEVVNQFQYLSSTTTGSLSLDTEISKRIGRAATTLAKLTKRVWDNKHLTITTKVKVYLCHQYPALRQQILGDLCASEKETSNLNY